MRSETTFLRTSSRAIRRTCRSVTPRDCGKHVHNRFKADQPCSSDRCRFAALCSIAGTPASVALPSSVGLRRQLPPPPLGGKPFLLHSPNPLPKPSPWGGHPKGVCSASRSFVAGRRWQGCRAQARRMRDQPQAPDEGRPRRVRGAHAAKIWTHFSPRRVRGEKYFSGRKCASEASARSGLQSPSRQNGKAILP